MKFRYLLTFYLMVHVIISCSPNSETGDQTRDTVNQKSKTSETQTPATDKKVIASEDYYITEIERKGSLLFGQYTDVDPSMFSATLQLLTHGLVTSVSNAGRVITGPMTLYYDKIPFTTTQLKVFIGIPVDKKFDNTGETEFISLKSGVFYKMECNAAAGETEKYHKIFQHKLKDNGLNFMAPVLEILSESRNEDMTFVNKTSILYSKD